MLETQGSVPTATETAATPTETPAVNAGVNGTPGAPGAAGDLTKEAAREAIRKHKLKVDGQEIEVDEEELKRGYSHQRAANKILQEGKSAKKQAEEFISMMKDPDKLQDAMLKMGYTRQQIRQLSEKVLAAELEDELMDPRERELKQTKNRLKQFEDMEKKQKEAVQKSHDDQMRAKYSEEYSKQFVAALQTEKLPGTKGTIAEMAKYIARSAKIGFQMTAAEAAKLVKEDIEKAHQNLYGESDAETLVRLLGENNLKKIRQFDTAKLKNPNNPTPQEQGTLSDRVKSAGKRMTPQEWRKYNRGY